MATAEKPLAHNKQLAEDVDPATGEIIQFKKASQALQYAETWEQAAEIMGSEVEKASEFGDGFTLLDERGKDNLVGVPFVVIAFNLNESKQYGGNTFASVRLITKDNKRLVFNDGGTGIVPFLQDFLKKTGRNYGLIAQRGLRVSEYEVEVNGKTIEAKTYYFDTSAAD